MAEITDVRYVTFFCTLRDAALKKTKISLMVIFFFCKVKIKQNAPTYPEIIYKIKQSFPFLRNTELKTNFLKKCNSAKYVT